MRAAETPQNDLIILVPDKNMDHTFQGLLSRHQAFNIREISFDIRIHIHRDPGVLNGAHHFLRPFVSRYEYCLVVFDHEGCGRETLSVEALQSEVQNRLRISGWGDRARVIVIDPELENWVWSDSPEVAGCLGWRQSPQELREWLLKEHNWINDQSKPSRPKEAFSSVLREVRKPRSSSIYSELASKVSFRRCDDPAFFAC